MAATERLRWRIVDMVDRLLPGQCWADLVSWVQDTPAMRAERGRLPWRPVGDMCRSDLPRTGTCYCGALGVDVPNRVVAPLCTQCCHAPVVLGPCMRGESDEEFWVFDLRCAACGRDAGSLVESWAGRSREDGAAAGTPNQGGGDS